MSTERHHANPRRRPIEAADLCQLASVKQVALHPRSDEIVHTIGWPDLTTDANTSTLHLLSEGSVRPLVQGRSDSGPRFSPEGTNLSFVRSFPGGGSALMVLGWDDRRLVEAARFADGIGTVRWLDERRLVLTAPGRPADQVGVAGAELARRPRTIDRLSYRFNGRGWTHDRRHQVKVIDLGDGTSGATVTDLADLVTEPGYPLDEVDHLGVAAAPDGSAVVVNVTGLDDDDITECSSLWLLPLDGGPGLRLTPPGGVWSHLVWHHEGPIVAVGLLSFDRLRFTRPHVIDPTGADPRPLGDGDVDAGPTVAGPGIVAVDGGVLTSSARRGCFAVERFDLADGTSAALAEGRFQVSGFDAARDGTVVGAVTTIDRPAELWHLAPGEPRRLASLNDDLLDRLDLAGTTEVEIPTADGRSVHAFVTRPPASAPDTSGPDGRPGLVYVHGGPASQYGWGFFDEFQMAAAAGYVVIAGNPTGSDGYGEEWATAVVGDFGGRDWGDVQAITDHLATLPEVDADRIGIGGGSYGGFMTAWAIGHSHRYRAALVERAVLNFASFAGTTDIPAFLGLMLDATPETDLAAIARQSPLTYAAKVTTPTLILHSEEDWRCPIEQAEQYFAALRRNGCEATLVRFPGEDHELTRSGSPRHRLERFEIVEAFYARHLLN